MVHNRSSNRDSCGIISIGLAVTIAVVFLAQSALAEAQGAALCSLLHWLGVS